MNPTHVKQITFLISIAFLSIGCEGAPLVRHYTEIQIEPPARQMMPMDDQHGFLQGMPQDAIHANLIPGAENMAMPQDDIHANLNPATMGMAMQSSPELEASVDRSPLKWKLPQGWSEAKGSGMRLATLKSADTETTIISLAGGAGGIASNIARWMQQVGIAPLSQSQMEDFLNNQEQFTTSSSLPVLIIDLTGLQQNVSPQSPSIIAAIINREQSQIFIKMTGTKEAVLSDRDDFLNLVRSIEPLE